MKKWWLVLVLVTAVAVVGGSALFWHPPQVANLQPAPITKVDNDDLAASGQLIKSPNVDAKKLFAHVQALNYERYTEAERDRARNYLTRSLKKFGWSPTLQSFEGGINIFAQRQGTDPQAGVILVAAHYDTVVNSPGADDNASGVAVVLEIARLFNSIPTPRTLQLAFFDQEELGLRGSIAFTTNKAHLENLDGVVVLDMVGFACYTPGCQKYPAGLAIAPPTDKGDFLAVVGDTEHLPLLNTFQNEEKSLPPVLTLPIPLKGMLMPDTLRSDHAPFWYQGIGAVLLTDTANLRTPHYHQPSDIPVNIKRSFFTGVAQIVINATTKLLDSTVLETQPSLSPSPSSSNLEP
ncbi:MAG: M28 family peptidase [Gloeocapsa sp. UFS-A4-WI-NPMV-4B04]|jgi:hypothetical protein|nr:M28 family peptidase [Gloeocapsa sp. UFS-A4-WI-NPMV-4B04]